MNFSTLGGTGVYSGNKINAQVTKHTARRHRLQHHAMRYGTLTETRHGKCHTTVHGTSIVPHFQREDQLTTVRCPC